MPETIHLASGASAATISTIGAEPVAWNVAGRELLWNGDPAFWPRVSPVLFPIVGRARGGAIRVGGRSYPMDIHGFAPSSEFSVAARGADHVRLALADDEATRARYPFAFSLTVEYRLSEQALDAAFAVANAGPEPLPFALGFHPGFRWPFAGGTKAGHAIHFEHAEDPHIPVITGEGLFASEKRRAPLDGRVLPLDDSVLAREALCFLGARSRFLRFAAPTGDAIRIEAENFGHWALWGRPGAGFVCMEAWTGHGDPDGFAGGLFEKPSMRRLAPGEATRHAVRIAFEKAGRAWNRERLSPFT